MINVSLQYCVLNFHEIQTKDKIQRQHTHNIIEKYMELSTLFVVSHELSAN